MQLKFVHLLIPKGKSEFIPTQEQIDHFFENLSSEGFLPENPHMTEELLSREGPETDQLFQDFGTRYSKEIQSYQKAAQDPVEIGALHQGSWKPRSDFPEWSDFDWRLVFRVCIRATPVCLSNLHENKTSVKTFGEPSNEVDGQVTHPISNKSILIPGGGSASFWIELEFWGWVAPRLGEDSVSAAQPAYLNVAAKSFGIDFVEGLFWHIDDRPYLLKS